MLPQHPTPSYRKRLTNLVLLVLMSLFLSACTAHASFDDQCVLNYGNLQVTFVTAGFDWQRDGWVCDDSHYGHPYVAPELTCQPAADTACSIDILVKVKYENGASWGLGYFTKSGSDYSPERIRLDPGESAEITFENSPNGKQCWPKSEVIKRITIAYGIGQVN